MWGNSLEVLKCFRFSAATLPRFFPLLELVGSRYSFTLMHWDIILALVLFILSIPVGVCSNLITPKVKDWWAARSRSSLAKRIRKLETEREEMTAIPEDSALEAVIRERSRQIIRYILFTALVLSFLVIGVLLLEVPETRFSQGFKTSLLILAGIFVVLLDSQYWWERQGADADRKRSPGYRRYLEITIVLLRKKLNAKQ